MNRLFYQTRVICCLSARYPVLNRFSHLGRSGSKSEQQHSDARIEEEARRLIFGPRDYLQLSEQEKKIVDEHQAVVYRDVGAILPNTRLAIEIDKAQALFRGRLAGKQ